MLEVPFRILSPAKINFFLNIEKKIIYQSKDYHQLNSLMGFVNLYDTIIIEPINLNKNIRLKPIVSSTLGEKVDSPAKPTRSDISSEQSDPKNPIKLHIVKSKYLSSYQLPNNDSNIIIKVTQYLSETFNIDQNHKITLKKHIPIGAGLGGGSSNAASILVAYNKVFKLGLTLTELCNIGNMFGADVPGLIYYHMGYNGVFVKNIGDQIYPKRITSKLPMLLINPKINLNTASVFKNIDHIASTPLINEHLLIHHNSIDNKTLITLASSHTNDLVKPAIKLCPTIVKVLQVISQTNSLVSNMSGSGSTCFAIYKNFADRKQAIKVINKILPEMLVYRVNLT